jgi:hypothetical protein
LRPNKKMHTKWEMSTKRMSSTIEISTYDLVLQSVSNNRKALYLIFWEPSKTVHNTNEPVGIRLHTNPDTSTEDGPLCWLKCLVPHAYSYD